MRLSKNGAADIRLHEGFVPSWYLDPVGIPTIGIGFTWRSASFRDWWAKHRPGQAFERGATMTKAEADDCLIALVDGEYGAAVNRFLAGKVVAQHVFDAMVSMVFNCGPGALEWRWAAAIKAGDLKGAADLLKVTAVTASGRRLQGLVNRRSDEAKLLLTGKYKSGGTSPDIGAPNTPSVDPAMKDGMLVRGERGAAVEQLQRDLIRHGFQPGKVDGIFGHGTESAVVAFQRALGLIVDGKAGPQTLGKLAA